MEKMTPSHVATLSRRGHKFVGYGSISIVFRRPASENNSWQRKLIRIQLNKTLFINSTLGVLESIGNGTIKSVVESRVSAWVVQSLIKNDGECGSSGMLKWDLDMMVSAAPIHVGIIE